VKGPGWSQKFYLCPRVLFGVEVSSLELFLETAGFWDQNEEKILVPMKGSSAGNAALLAQVAKHLSLNNIEPLKSLTSQVCTINTTKDTLDGFKLAGKIRL